MATYTQVRYFGPDELEELFDALSRLRLSFERRRDVISRKGERAIARRLEVLNAVAQMLAEPVPRSYE